MFVMQKIQGKWYISRGFCGNSHVANRAYVTGADDTLVALEIQRKFDCHLCDL
jgi:hypothetical protein